MWLNITAYWAITGEKYWKKSKSQGISELLRILKQLNLKILMLFFTLNEKERITWNYNYTKTYQLR